MGLNCGYGILKKSLFYRKHVASEFNMSPVSHMLINEKLQPQETNTRSPSKSGSMVYCNKTYCITCSDEILIQHMFRICFLDYNRQQMFTFCR
jgi:hypothetical protein